MIPKFASVSDRPHHRFGHPLLVIMPPIRTLSPDSTSPRADVCLRVGRETQVVDTTRPMPVLLFFPRNTAV